MIDTGILGEKRELWAFPIGLKHSIFRLAARIHRASGDSL